MPANKQETRVQITGFAGLNERLHPSEIDDRELSVCKNFIADLNGKLKPRPGFRIVTVPPVTPASSLAQQWRVWAYHIGYWATSGHTSGEFYFSADNNDATDDATATWQSMGFPVLDLIEFDTTYAYLIARHDIRKWTKNTLTNTIVSGGPAGGGAQAAFKERLFVVPTIGDSGKIANRLYFSDAGNWDSWPSTNFIDVGHRHDEVGALLEYNDRLIIFKQESIWVLIAEGDPADWVLRQISDDYGALAQDAVATHGSLIYFIDRQGIYRTDLTTFDELSLTLDADFFDDRGEPRAGAADAISDSIMFWEEYILFRVDGDTQQYAIDPRIFCFDPRTGIITEWIFDADVMMPYDIAYSPFHRSYMVASGVNYLGGTNANKGKILTIDPTYRDEGAVFPIEAQTKEFIFDQPADLKRGKWMGLWGENFSSAANDLELTHYVDGVAQTPFTLAQASTNVGLQHYKLKGPGYFRTWKLKLAQADAVDEPTIMGIDLTMSFKAKQIVLER